MKLKHKGLTRFLATLLSLLLIIGMTGCENGGSDADSAFDLEDADMEDLEDFSVEDLSDLNLDDDDI